MANGKPPVIIDLDALAPPDLNVRLGGKTYRFPGDCPLPVFLRIQALQQKVDAGEDEDALLADVQEVILELFQVKQPTMKQLPAGIGVIGLMSLIGTLYGAEDTAAPADPPVPAKKRPAAGTRSTSRPKK